MKRLIIFGFESYYSSNNIKKNDWGQRAGEVVI